MPGWIWQTIVYAPLVLNFLRTVPLVLTPAILPRFGPLVMITLCGREPVHWNFTVSPERMVSRDGPNLRWGPTLTVFVAANAGTAIAAATVATATSSAMRRFMRWSSLLVSVGEVFSRTPGDGASFPVRCR